ncbi:MAG: phosphatase PAP2 family protein [Chitinophagaceae bacterium]|nr:phosphatase PAP2 family protein [Chitinophagaceae bacterium]
MPPLFFDEPIIFFFNQIANKYLWLTRFILFISQSHLLKGGILVTVCWYTWFINPGPQMTKTRKGIFTTFTGSFIAIFVTRVLVNIFPFRARPILNKELGLKMPSFMDPSVFDNLSSFPSDHATIYMALSYGIWKTNKKVGWFCIIYSVLFIFIPRIYLGLHYPSDILIGILIGITFVELGFQLNILQQLNSWLVVRAEKKPQFFYPFLFLLTYQIADLFDDGRGILTFIWKAIK